jgi:hypothetical protein
VSRRGLAIGGLLLAFTAACASPSSPGPLPADAIRFTGTVQFNDLEGGFWAIKADNGLTYDPENGLPALYQAPNLRVVVTARLRSDLGSIHMVGPIVEILQIQAKD